MSLSVCVCATWPAGGVLFHSNPLLKVGRTLDRSVFQLLRNPHTCGEPRCVCVCVCVCWSGGGRVECIRGAAEGVSLCKSFVFTQLCLGVPFSLNSMSIQWAGSR